MGASTPPVSGGDNCYHLYLLAPFSSSPLHNSSGNLPPMKKTTRFIVVSAFAGMLTILAVIAMLPVPTHAQGEHLILSGDLAYFFGPGKPRNCTLNNRYKHG